MKMHKSLELEFISVRYYLYIKAFSDNSGLLDACMWLHEDLKICLEYVR